MKNTIGFLIEVTLNLEMALGSIDILVILAFNPQMKYMLLFVCFSFDFFDNTL